MCRVCQFVLNIGYGIEYVTHVFCRYTDVRNVLFVDSREELGNLTTEIGKKFLYFLEEKNALYIPVFLLHPEKYMTYSKNHPQKAAELCTNLNTGPSAKVDLNQGRGRTSEDWMAALQE